ncbi:MAG: hypothetical protein AB1465_01140 [Patescibacteria group bacterium]
MEDIELIKTLVMLSILGIVLAGIIIIVIKVFVGQEEFKSISNSSFYKGREPVKCRECGKMFYVSKPRTTEYAVVRGKSVIGDYLREPKYCSFCSRILLAEIDRQMAKSLHDFYQDQVRQK